MDGKSYQRFDESHIFLEGSCVYSQIINDSHQGHHCKSNHREVTIPHLKSNGY